MSAAHVTPLFLTPLRTETLAVRLVRPRPEVRRVGMGPVSATAAMARLTRSLGAPRPLVLLGFGGALDPELTPGELVVARSVSGVASDEKLVIPEADDVGEMLRAAGLRAHVSGIVSVPRVLVGDVEREKAAAGGAVMCDMESLWMAPLARRHPFVVVRAVVDAVGTRFVSVSTPAAAARGFASLVRAGRVLARWSPTSVGNYPLVEAGEP